MLFYTDPVKFVLLLHVVGDEDGTFDGALHFGRVLLVEDGQRRVFVQLPRQVDQLQLRLGALRAERVLGGGVRPVVSGGVRRPPAPEARRAYAQLDVLQLHVLTVLHLRSAHAQHSRQDVEEDLARPVGHGVRGGGAVVDVVREDGHGYGDGDEEERKDEVLSEQRHDERRRRNYLGEHEEEDGER